MKFQTQHTQRMQHNICTVTRFYHYYNSELLLLLFIGGPQIMCLSVFVCLRKRDLYPISLNISSFQTCSHPNKESSLYEQNSFVEHPNLVDLANTGSCQPNHTCSDRYH